MAPKPDLKLIEVGGHCFAWLEKRGPHDADPQSRVAPSPATDAELAQAALAWAYTCDRLSIWRVANGSDRSVVRRHAAGSSDLTPWSQMVSQLGYEAALVMPLAVDGTLFGTFLLFSCEPQRLDESELKRLEGLARHLGSAVPTARLCGGLPLAEDQVLESERRRVLTTLQEVVGRSLPALILGLKSGRSRLERGQPLPLELLDQMIAEAGAVTLRLRDLSQRLRPPYLERLAFVDAIRYHCRELSARGGTTIRVATEGIAFRLSEAVKERAFFCVREALDNALSHARASQIDVSVAVRSNRWLSIEVRDNGVGFDTGAALRRPIGRGLRAICEQAQSIFGQAEIQSAPQQGTRVRISVPLIGERARWL